VGIISRTIQGIRGLFNRERGKMGTIQALSAAPPQVSDKHIENLILAKNIYAGTPPWLNDTTPPMKPTGYGAIVSNEIARLVMTRSEIKIEDEKINEIIQKRVVSKLQQYLEKGYALGGLIFKPFYSNANIEFANDENGKPTNRVIGIEGTIKIIHHTPESFLIDEYDDAGDIQQIRFFSTVKIADNWYTKVELQRYDEATRTLTINNTVFETGNTAPTRFRWDNLGEKTVPLTSIPRWAKIHSVMTLEDVDGCLIGVYMPPVANNEDDYYINSMPPLVRARHALRFLDKIQFLIDWELDATRSRMLLDEMAIDGVIENNVMPEELKSIIVKLHGRGDTNIYEVFSPAIRHEAFTKLNEMGKRWLEDVITFTHSQLSEKTGRTATATEILQNSEKTISTKQNNQTALGYAIEQLAYSIQAIIYPTKPKTHIAFEFVWGSLAIISNQDRVAQLLNRQRAGGLPQWRVNMLLDEVSEENGKQWVYDALEEEIIVEKKRLELLKKHGMKESDFAKNPTIGGYDFRHEGKNPIEENNDGN